MLLLTNLSSPADRAHVWTEINRQSLACYSGFGWFNSFLFPSFLVNLSMTCRIGPTVNTGLPEKCTISCFSINYSTVRIKVGLVLVLVLICSIRTANRLSHVVSTDYKTWCGALFNCFSALLFLFEFIYALLPHCTFCHRCSLRLPCGATSFGGHCHLLNQNQNHNTRV